MPDELILVIEDEEDIQELLAYNLTREGYRVICYESGEEGLEITKTESPDLIVLDLMLPGMEGLEVCRQLKADVQTRRIPVIILTARGEEEDIIAGFEAGADDYVTKPFSPRVLSARVGANLRRKAILAPETDTVLRYYELTIHPGRHAVKVMDEPVNLTHTEFRILHYLMSRPGWVFTRNQIVRAVHGEDYPVTGRSVDVQIAALRKKLGAAGAHIQTVRGVGYKLGD
jgi:two-component system phosphate regulon response regulator PhoB